MKKLYILILIGVGLSSGLQSCKPDEPASPRAPDFVPTPQLIKDYNFFNYGSWWIYHDSVNNLYDTVTVVEVKQGVDTFRKDGKIQFYYDWFTVNTFSSNTGYNFEYSYSGSWANLVWRTKYKPGQYVGETICFFDFPIGTKRAPYTQKGIVTLIDTIATMEIRGNQFASIYHFEDNENITEEKGNTQFYFAKNVGIVRKVIDSSITWDIVDYNINK